ncbi:hypothetical protein DDZ18_12795 [Marinicauda salina]|uniref:CAAX prenyl protease 2/Lysostaphin resistance protein A-like domain-containing protein n=1 Tax=Marinicauda salina TaxID=2135793 RepID=A0A2U2BRJ7_9PROT|nr:CPBP family intramembrane glutamic endopeptidase [Marinicauda salina]PWE16634.1 hypothetical protein DDZ18_12795 [Marinicauda salina]
MTADTLYAPWPEGSRRTWGWAAIALVVVSYFVSALPIGIGVVVFTVQRTMAGAGPAEIEAALAGSTMSFLIPLLLAQFVLWGGLAIAWAKLFEKRTLASLGLVLRGWSRRYGGGLLVGVGLVVVLTLGVGLVATGAPEAADAGELELAGADWSRLAETGILLALVGVAAVFLIQGAAEELVFRGWLMSTLVARWGRVAGVVASCLVFMLFHAHVFISGLAFGAVAMLGVGATGVFFAVYALWTRNIVGVAAVHGAFNASAVIGPVAGRLAAEPDRPLGDIVSEVFESATGMAGPEAVAVGPELFVQLVLFGALSGIMVWRLSRRRAAAAMHE